MDHCVIESESGTLLRMSVFRGLHLYNKENRRRGVSEIALKITGRVYVYVC